MRRRSKVLIRSLAAVAAAALLGGEPLVRADGDAHATAAWESVLKDGALWCEGCCTGPTYSCCYLNKECRIIIDAT